MTLMYWYMHWFWITTILTVNASSCSELTSATTIFTDDPDENTIRSGKSVVEIPPMSSPANSIENSTPNPTKLISVIIPNTTTTLTDNLMSLNSTTNITTIDSDERTNFVNETALATSERMGEDDVDSPDDSNLSAAGITCITLGCVSIVGILSAISFLVYRYRGLNRPHVLSDRCSNLDSSGYIDDTSIRDNSEEMYSLDNDSFLNSLEAMTIQNYWTDTVKHTKLCNRSSIKSGQVDIQTNYI